jgi:hypothetical protein
MHPAVAKDKWCRQWQLLHFKSSNELKTANNQIVILKKIVENLQYKLAGTCFDEKFPELADEMERAEKSHNSEVDGMGVPKIVTAQLVKELKDSRKRNDNAIEKFGIQIYRQKEIAQQNSIIASQNKVIEKLTIISSTLIRNLKEMPENLDQYKELKTTIEQLLTAGNDPLISTQEWKKKDNYSMCGKLENVVDESLVIIDAQEKQLKEYAAVIAQGYETPLSSFEEQEKQRESKEKAKKQGKGRYNRFEAGGRKKRKTKRKKVRKRRRKTHKH